jgi:quinol monooxygenase YgiN
LIKRAIQTHILHPARHARALLAWKRYRFTGLPVIFGNAIPKSGSKLLQQLLRGFAAVGPFVEIGSGPIRMITIDGRQRSSAEVLADLGGLRAGDIALGYLRATPEHLAFFTQAQQNASPRWAHYFIYRDPRDLLVSQVYYATEIYADHALHEFYNRLPDMDARLTAVIQGIHEDEKANRPGIADQYSRFIAWLNFPGVLPVRFEDLIQNRAQTINAMLDHLEAAGYRIPLDRQAAIDRVSRSIDPKRSPTFRKGVVGDWREHFTTEHKRLFKESAGDLLVQLGYEKNNDW